MTYFATKTFVDWMSQQPAPLGKATLELGFINALNNPVDENTLVIPSGATWEVQANTTITANLSIAVQRGGQININNGVELKILGEVVAGPYHIFHGDGTVTGTMRNEHVLPQWFGVVGDKNHDDGKAFQLCLTYCSEYNKTCYLPSGTYIQVKRNLFFYGKCNLVGESRDECQIILTGDLQDKSCDTWFVPKPGVRKPNTCTPEEIKENLGSSRYWINVGIKGIPKQYHGDPQDSCPWSGILRDITFLVKKNQKNSGGKMDTFQLHNAEDWLIENVKIDITPIKSKPTGIMSSYPNTNWNKAAGLALGDKLKDRVVSRGTIRNCIFLMYANNVHPGPGGINLTRCDNVTIEGNYICKSTDDVCVIIDGTRNKIINNYCYTTRGKLGCLGGRDTLIQGNYIEVVVGDNKAWAPGGNMLVAIIGGTSSPACDGIQIIGNEAYLPIIPKKPLTDGEKAGVKRREEILRIHIKKIPLSEDVDLEVLARSTPVFSREDLANLVQEAVLLAAFKDKDKVSMKDFETVRNDLIVRSKIKKEDANFIMLNVSGAQNTICQGNLLRNDCNPEVVNVIGIRTGTDPFLAWQNPKGIEDPDKKFNEETGGLYEPKLKTYTSRPRSLKVVGNHCIGNYPASIEEGALYEDDIVGPIQYSGNQAGYYNIAGRTSTFMSDNVTKTPWEVAYEDLRGISVVDGSKLVSFETMSKVLKDTHASLMIGKNIETFQPGYKGIILYAVANTRIEPKNGSFMINFQINGKDVLMPLEIPQGSRYEILDFRHCKDRAFGPSDNIEALIHNKSDSVPWVVVDIYAMKVRDII